MILTNLIWLAIAWVGGTAAILGSLMTLASLLLWLVPSSDLPAWEKHLKLMAFSAAIAVAGFALLLAFPFPNAGE